MDNESHGSEKGLIANYLLNDNEINPLNNGPLHFASRVRTDVSQGNMSFSMKLCKVVKANGNIVLLEASIFKIN